MVASDIAQIARRRAQQQLGKSAEGSSRGHFVVDLRERLDQRGLDA